METSAAFENAEATNNEATEAKSTEERPMPEMPFYLMRPAPFQEAVTGSTNLILHNERQQSFKQYCCKKVKESLKAFLTHCPGNIDTPAIFMSDDELKETCTLNSLLNNSRLVFKEIHPLTASQFSSFRLYPGPLPEKYMEMVQSAFGNGAAAAEGSSGKKAKKSKKSADGEGHSEKRKKKKEKKKKKKSSGND